MAYAAVAEQTYIAFSLENECLFEMDNETCSFSLNCALGIQVTCGLSTEN
jgi:hypothetical protein